MNPDKHKMIGQFQLQLEKFETFLGLGVFHSFDHRKQ
jgi:hypothetical protein